LTVAGIASLPHLNETWAQLLGHRPRGAPEVSKPRGARRSQHREHGRLPLLLRRGTFSNGNADCGIDTKVADFYAELGLVAPERTVA